MEHSSRKETFRRKRSRSKRKWKRRWVTSAFIVAFFSLTLLLWFIYNGMGGGETPGDAAPTSQGQQGQGQTPSPSDGSGGGNSDPGSKPEPSDRKEPDGGAGAGDGSKKPDDPGPSQQGSAPAGGTNGGEGKSPDGSVGQGGTKPEGGDKAPSASTPPAAGDGGGWADDSERVRLTFVGDVIFADNVEVALKANGYDYPYRNVRTYLEQADLTIANLETPITERGTAEVKQYAYRSSPKALPAFKEAGVDLVNLANNHILDYGTTGLLDTFEHLDKAGIRWFGAGRNASEAFKPVIVEEKGVKIAFLGFSKVVPTQEWKAGKDRPGVADTYALKAPLDAIRKARTQADLVVVVAHWGIERHDTPEAYQRDFAREYIDAGADLVVGGHPHVLQGFENYKGKWIAYSLGNFIFTMNENPLTWEALILQASCSKEGGCSLKAVPVLTKLANPEPMTGETAAKLYERLTSISFDAEVGKDGTVQISGKK